MQLLHSAVASVRYPPQGTRSAGGTRMLLYGEDYFSAANPEILLAVMLETRQALANVDDILSVPGIDCAFIGPGDLAIDLGTYGRQSDEHEAALQAILQAGQRHGVAVGLACGSPEVGKRRAAQGFQFVDVGVDISFFWQGLREDAGSVAQTWTGSCAGVSMMRLAAAGAKSAASSM